MPALITGLVVAGGLGLAGYSQLPTLGQWLFERGQRAQEEGDLQGAVVELERARLVFDTYGDARGAAASLELAARCTRPGANPAGSWRQTTTLLRTAIDLREQIGDVLARALALRELALCRQRDRDPAGDWQEAKTLHEQSADLFRQLGNQRELRTALHWAAWCVTPTAQNPEGDWDAALQINARALEVAREGKVPAVELAESLRALAHCHHKRDHGDLRTALLSYSEAAELSGAAGAHADHAASLRAMGEILVDDRNPQPKVERACTLFARAARLFDRAGEVLSQAECFGLLAHWQIPGRNPNGSWQKAVTAYETAAKLCARVEANAEEAKFRHWLAWSLQPNRNPDGDWSLAAASYQIAAQRYGGIQAVAKQAQCLIDQGYCLARGRRENVSSVAREVMARGIELLRDMGNDRAADAWQPWIDETK